MLKKKSSIVAQIGEFSDTKIMDEEEVYLAFQGTVCCQSQVEEFRKTKYKCVVQSKETKVDSVVDESDCSPS